MKLSEILLPACMFLVACGEQTGFVSERAALEGQKGSDLATHSYQPEEEPGDETEEIAAEIPVIISGSFLACFRSGETRMSCQFKPDDKALLDLLEMNRILEIKPDGQSQVLLRIEQFSSENGTLVLAGSEPDLNRLEEKITSDRNKPIEGQLTTGEQTKIEEPMQQEETIEPVQEETVPAESTPPEEASPVPAPAEEAPVQLVLAPTNLVENGSFEADIIADNSIQKVGFESGLSNWTRTLGVTSEIQRNIYSWPAQDGNQWTELCSTGDSGLKQTVATVPGDTYRLKFYFSPQPNVPEEFNHLHVKIDGTEVFHQSSDGSALIQTIWALHEMNFTASSDSTEIEFHSSGCTDLNGDPVSNMGTFVDNVQVYQYVKP